MSDEELKDMQERDGVEHTFEEFYILWLKNLFHKIEFDKNNAI